MIPVNVQIGGNRGDQDSSGVYKSWNFSIPEGKVEKLEKAIDSIVQGYGDDEYEE